MSESVDSAWRDKVHDQYDRLHATYDRTVLTLAGGALALSVTFITDVVPTASEAWRLGWAWALLVLSLAFIALSYIPSIRAHRRVLLGLEGKWWGRTADVLSIGAGLLLAAGLGFLAWFAFANLPTQG